MGFILDGLEGESYDRQYDDRVLLRRIVEYFRPYARQMGVVALMLTLNSLAGTASPIIVSRAIDLLSNEATVRGIALLSIGIGLLGVFAWGFNFIRQWVSARIVGNVVLQLRQDAFEATIEHDMSFYDEHPTGKIVSRVTSDTQAFSDVVSLVTNLLSQVMLVALLTGFLFTVDVRLTLVLLAMAPLAIIIALSFRRIARRVTLKSRQVTAKVNAQIQESISGIVVAKSFRQEQAIYAEFESINVEAYRSGLARGLTLNGIFPILSSGSGLGIALLIYLAGLATRTRLTPGDWYLYMQAVGFFWWPLINIASFWSQFQDGLSAAERVFALIDADPNVRQRENRPVPRLEGDIRFEKVNFAYVSGEPVLRGFDLHIKPRETIAFVGHTGAGKSSIARLITRFYEFQEGRILIDGRDLRTLDLQAYRRHIGLVPQSPFLFGGTVAENIRYGRPEATDDEVLAAAQGISGGSWLQGLPVGLETDVGERGGNLSMGQRQLVALARVLLKDPAIFILDEATASVDPFTETQIQEGLEVVMAARTAIVIAHRLSTVRNADRIIVLDHGRIIEEGTHDQLLANGGHYAELYNTYFRHQSLEYINGATWTLELEQTDL